MIGFEWEKGGLSMVGRIMSTLLALLVAAVLLAVYVYVVPGVNDEFCVEAQSTSFVGALEFIGGCWLG